MECIYKQYEIVLLNLNPNFEEDEKGKFMGIVLSPDAINKNLDYLEIAPLILEKSKLPTRIKISTSKNSGLTKPMYIVLDQKRTIMQKRVISKMGNITQKEKTTIFDTLVEMYRISE